MENLTHWDFAENFSGFDAAALMLGIEPRELDDDSRIRVVIDRMELHYNHALKRHYQEALNLNSMEFLDTEANRPFELESVRMNELFRQCYPAPVDASLADWVVSKDQSRFDIQIFSRHAIADWLSAIGLKSSYQFRFEQPSVDSEVKGRWPWGDHHTVLLGHLEAAAVRYWVHYDPTDATSAPINKDVAEWLVKDRKVSKNMAASIASMLRVDGLPPGPRT